MRYQFTPAAERALTYASGWSSRNGYDELEAEPLLLGLLAEPECRAAAMLARAGHRCSGRPPPLAEIEPKKDHTTAWGQGTFSREVGAFAAIRLRATGRLPAAARISDRTHPFGARGGRSRGVSLASAAGAQSRRVGRGNPPTLRIPTAEEAAAREDGVSTFIGGECLAGSESAAKSQSSDESARAIARSVQELPRSACLDAAANRAREGLRVVEDYVRFVLDDRHLTALCKQLRHDLTDALARISADTAWPPAKRRPTWARR